MKRSAKILRGQLGSSQKNRRVQTRNRPVNLRQGRSNAVRRYHVCRGEVGVPHTGQIAPAALGTTLITTEPPGSIARLVIRQRSLPTSRSLTFTAALPPPAYLQSSLTGSRSSNLPMSRVRDGH